MKITEKEQNGLKREYNVVVPEKDVTTKYDAKLNSLAKEAKIQGFRPGKVPPSVLKARFGASLLSEVLEEMLGETINALYKEKNITPAYQPAVDVKEFGEGKDLEFVLKLEILPEVPEVDFSTIKIKKVYADVTDDVVQKELERLAEAKRDTVKIEEDKKAEKGDVAVIDFVGSIDGKEFDGGKGDNYSLELGSGAFIAGFEDQLIGKKAGEDVVVAVTFPEDYQAKQLAGKPAEFKVKINELRKIVKTEVNDEFAKKFGKKDLEELKEEIKKEITEAYEGVTFMHLKRALLDELSALCKFEVPEVMKNAEFNAIWSQAEAEAKANNETLTDEDKKEYSDIADRRIRLGLLLTEVGKKNEIRPNSADINRALIAEARNFPGQAKMLFEYYQKNKNFRENINSRVFEDKVMSFILDKVTQEPLKVTEEELYSYYDDEPKKEKKEKVEKKTTKSTKADKSEKTEKTETVAKKESAEKGTKTVKAKAATANKKTEKSKE